MSSYERLATDVDATEEAELRRLEGGAAARTCRRQHDTGADHETGACTASDAAAAADSGVDGSAFAHAAGHAAPPLLGAVEGKVLAPRLVNRTACLVESISKFKWRVAAGEAVAHFLAANGPPEIVSYNWNKVASWSCPVAVCREPVCPLANASLTMTLPICCDLLALARVSYASRRRSSRSSTGSSLLAPAQATVFQSTPSTPPTVHACAVEHWAQCAPASKSRTKLALCAYSSRPPQRSSGKGGSRLSSKEAMCPMECSRCLHR